MHVACCRRPLISADGPGFSRAGCVLNFAAPREGERGMLLGVAWPLLRHFNLHFPFCALRNCRMRRVSTPAVAQVRSIFYDSRSEARSSRLSNGHREFFGARFGHALTRVVVGVVPCELPHTHIVVDATWPWLAASQYEHMQERPLAAEIVALMLLIINGPDMLDSKVMRTDAFWRQSATLVVCLVESPRHGEALPDSGTAANMPHAVNAELNWFAHQHKSYDM
eukprot:1976563-Pleurochrysis_carterae.AAC.2